MSNEFNNNNETKEDKLRKIDDFFNQFEEKNNDNSAKVDEFLSRFNETENEEKLEEEIEAKRKTRMERLKEKKSSNKNSFFFKDKASNELNDEENNMKTNKNENTKKHKYRLNPKKFILFLLGLCLVCGIGLLAFVFSIIADAPKIDPNNIYSLLSESSTLYDDQGQVIENLFASEGIRTNVEYKDLPQDLVDAFVSIEDKTFWDHHGFNFVRILGAIKDSITSGKISGTSTITQQLARNLYLSETKSERTLTRKIKEAYYTVLLERHLNKEEIIEAYLNTIYLGYNSYGVQAASQSYFSKDVGELDLLECAALASLPPAPDSYALIKKIKPENITDPNNENILLKGDEFYYVYNDISKNRRETCLNFMKEQEHISDEELTAALDDKLKDHLKTKANEMSDLSSYFADYVIEQVVDDLVKETGKTKAEAKQAIYTGGLQIYTTMDSNIQRIAENEFSNNKNFPGVKNLKKDSKNGNILNSAGNVILYNYDTYFQEDGSFLLNSDEYKKNSDGSLTIYKGNRLNIYKVEYQGVVDYNLEFKSMYTTDENKIFYIINSGVITIPAKYKTRDSKGNLVISSKLFTDMPKVFKSTENGLSIPSDYYTLKQKVIQPQSAMVISDPYNGSIKAMVGGRNTVGRLLHNRAVKPRQPGSSIKPIGVYAPALQVSADTAKSGTTMKFSDKEGVSKLLGNYFTAASVIDDTPLIIQGKQWPKNWYSGYRGLCTFRYSIEQSINVNAVRIFQQLGVQKSLSFLKGVGVSTIVESGGTNDLNAAALALGGMTNGISPLEMSAAYGAFVNDGKYTTPIAYTKVTNKREEVLLETAAASNQAMDSGVAFIMRDLLRTTVTNGLGKRASIPNQPVAGKTGTTTNNYDAWFVGFTPQYSAAVWIGNDVNIELSQGSASAARLWNKIMTQVCANIPTGKYHTAPSNVISVTIDTKSGKLPSSLSSLDPEESTVRSEYFIKGTEPKTTDDVHQYVTVCTETGYLATPYCTSTKKVLGVKRPYMPNPVVADIKYEVPHYYCNIHNPDPGKYPVDPNGSINYNFNGVDSTEPEQEIIDSNDEGNTEENQNNNPIEVLPPSNTNGNKNNNNKNNNSSTNQETEESPAPDWIILN